MRKPLIAILLLLLGIGGIAKISQNTPINSNEATVLKSGFNELSVTVDNSNRPYLLYIPDSYKDDSPAPLVVFLHGGLGDMNHAKIYGLQDNADMSGTLLVLANGVSALPKDKLATWNAGGCCDYARDTNSDDISYIRQIVHDVTQLTNIDTRKVYAAGMSNGGMMSYRIACEAADVFAAIASVAGTDSTQSCAPSEEISILHIHARDDTHVLFNGGAGEDAYRDHTKVMNFRPVSDTIMQWVKYNNLNTNPSRTYSVDGAYCDTYSEANTPTEVTLCITETGGHSWPGAEINRLMQPSQALNANDVIWEFFSQHHK